MIECMCISFTTGITLSACGASETFTASREINVPIFLLDGSSDCLCPPETFANTYYDIISNNDCKFLNLLTNATHCNFANLGEIEETHCDDIEHDHCPFKNMTKLPEITQQIYTNKYIKLWLDAILKNNENINYLKNMVTIMQNDTQNGIIQQFAYDCQV